MDNTSRWLVWTGPLFTVLLYVTILGLEGSTPGEKASGAEVVDYFNAHQGRIAASAFLAPASATLLLLFVSHLRTVVRDSAAAGPWPTVMLAGAVLWASSVLIGGTVSLALVTSADHGQEQVAQTMNVLNNDSWIPFIAGIAITMIGAGMTVLGTGVLPRWAGWVAAVVGVVSLLGPGGFVGFVVGPLWLLVAGVLLARAPAAAEPVAA